MSTTIVVTGATNGLGREIARRLAREGHRVLGVGRDAARAADLQAQLHAAGARGCVVVAIDLATTGGQRAFANLVHRQTDHVDALINNAGVMHPKRQQTTDGYELNFAVHHLLPFALTSRLLPLLRAGRMPAGPGGVDLARLVNVNSAGHQTSLGGHHNPRLDFDDLQSLHSYDPFLAYSRSKLANLLFTYELARRHGHELIVNAVHPGMVRTNIGRHWPKLQVAAMQAFALSPAKAAAAVTALATQPIATNGAYYDRTTPTRSSPPSYDRTDAGRLWHITEQICGPLDPGASVDLTAVPGS
jgi:NAD(P)-dependent dehydrogenase (short-subunit alcohol dehydrogenase family)